MKVIHINAGGEVGGGKTHIVSLVSALGTDTAELLVFEEGPVAASARQAGCQVHVIEQSSRYDVSVLKRLRTFLNDGEYDMIHTHGARANFMMSLIINQLKPKWLMTVHSDPMLDFQGRGIVGKVFQTLNIQSIRQADHIITVSEALKEQLQQSGAKQENLSVVRNGISFGPPPVEQKKNKVFTLFYAARLHPIKGHSLLFRSLKEAALPDWKLLLAGDGELRSELEAEAAKLGLENQIHFLGWVASEEVRELIQSADVSLLASYSETFPLVLLESANEGVPFIATDVGDVKHLLPDPAYGWLIPPNSPASFIQAFQEASKEWEAGQLQKKGICIYERTKELFSIEKMASNTYSVYEKVMKE